MPRYLLIAAALLILPAACTPLTPTLPAATAALDAPSLTWTETLPAPTASETPTIPFVEPFPLQSDTPVLTATPGLLLPTLAHPTASATSLPQPDARTAAIQFYAPGPMSSVTSPLHFYGYAVPGDDNKGLLTLHGEDGSLLADELLQLNTSYKWAYFNWSVDFEPRAAAEFGRLSLTTFDQYGRITAVQSVPLLLLDSGMEIINPPGELAERCTVTSPLPGERISGGTVIVSGEFQPYNSLPLIVELLNRAGVSVGSQLVAVLPGQEGVRVAFTVQIPYSVTEYTSVRLTLRQPDERIGGTFYLSSQEINLNP